MYSTPPTESTARTPENSDMLARYQRARHLLQSAFGAKTVVYNATVFPVWIGHSNSFWYVRRSPEGKEFRLVDAQAATNRPAFDHEALALALAASSRQEVSAADLPISDVEISLDPLCVDFKAFEKRWRFNGTGAACTELEIPSTNEVVSPDGAYAVFARDHNIWLCDKSSGEERALTTDGEELFVYGAASTGWGFPNGVSGLQARWSPDSRRVFFVQRDTRRVKALPIVHHVPKAGIRPVVEEVRLALPGDEGIEEVRLLSVDIETGVIVEARHGQIPTTRNGNGFFDCGLGWWGRDSRLAYFVDVDRWYKYARVVEFNTDNGECRILFEERSATHINLMLNQDAHPSFLPLPETNEILWFSERTGWAHFYLYELKTGELKNAVTSGPGLARNIVRYIPERRELFVQMAGRVEGRDPYYRDLTRVNIDTGEMTTLASSDHEYVVMSLKPLDITATFLQLLAGAPILSCGVSNSGDYAVVTRSRADEVPVSYLIDRNGTKVINLEIADVSGLPESWQWPEPVKLKAADGKTDIYGLVFRPSGFDPGKSWPVVSHGFNQPEISWVSKGSFTNGTTAGASYMDAAATAELGFIVVQIDGRGSPEREKAFYDRSYGWYESASSIDDHAAGIRQLVERYPYMDLARVGVAAHASGGSGALHGLLKHPDLFKVGVTTCPHDGRLMPAQMTCDKYDGPAGSERKQEYPEDYVHRLEGKLLMMCGMLDASTPPTGVFRVVQALQKANKDFDMILLPDLGHGLNAYLVRRAWDYLVRHLIGVEAPKEFDLIFTEHSAQPMDE